MNERDQAMVGVALQQLRPVVEQFSEAGWFPEVVVLAPEEIKRIPGFKVALVLPVQRDQG